MFLNCYYLYYHCCNILIIPTIIPTIGSLITMCLGAIGFLKQMFVLFLISLLNKRAHVLVLIQAFGSFEAQESSQPVGLLTWPQAGLPYSCHLCFSLVLVWLCRFQIAVGMCTVVWLHRQAQLGCSCPHNYLHLS